MQETNRANFGSRLGVILATAGSAVGLGNVWRFPYMAGENGGALFILIYLVFVIFLCLPCLISEFIIGRHGQANTARAYIRTSGSKKWGLIGALGVLTGFVITSYYAVVSGWCLQYITASILNDLPADAASTKTYFNDFMTDPVQPILWTVVFFAVTHFIITQGVQKGIEKASKLLMPLLFIILLVIVVASCCLPGAGRGIEFLFRPDFSKMDSSLFLGAMGQAFYSLSIGMGCLCTYASYFSRDTNLTKSAVQICAIDTAVAILAGLMIFPAAFSVGIEPDSGPSLVFITLPTVFQNAFGSVPFLANGVALLFYALLALAALTSLISLHEVSTAFFHEELHVSRKWAATINTVISCSIGCLCSLSLGVWDGLSLFGMSMFDLFDFCSGQIFLPFGGLLTCIFVGWFMSREIIRDQFTNWGTLPTTFYRTYLILVKYVCPTGILAIFLHQMGVF